jgi:hypothetical protein
VKDKLSIAHKGTKKPRTKEHQQKIIDSKIRNGTTKHKSETATKIRNSLTQKYQQDENPPVYLPKGRGGGGRNYDRGYIHGFFYRSSYEKQFIITCHDNSIDIISAENKEFRVPYIMDNKRKFYYPDFYLPKYDAIIEIKPTSMFLVEETFIKLDAGAKHHENYIILTEEELFDSNLQWVAELEYLLPTPEPDDLC